MDRNEKKRITQLRKDAEKLLKEARREWKDWRDGFPGMHIAYALTACTDKCGYCDGCVSAKYRWDKRTEIEAGAEVVTSVIKLVDHELKTA